MAYSCKVLGAGCASPLEHLIEEINFQRAKEMRQLLKDDSGFVMLHGTAYWTDLFVRHFLFEDDRSAQESDDLIFFIRKRHLKEARKYIPRYETLLEVFRRDSKKLPIGDPEIDWEETIYTNLIIHNFDYYVTLAVCTRTSPKELQVLKRHTERVWASPSRRLMSDKGTSEEITYPNICFMLDNFDEVFTDIVVRDGEMVSVELVARDRGGSLQSVIFLGSVRYDALKRVYDARTSLGTKMAQRVTFGLFAAPDSQRMEFVRVKGPMGKGHAELAITKPPGQGCDTPTSEPGYTLTDQAWDAELEELNQRRRQRRMSDPSGNLDTFLNPHFRMKPQESALARSEGDGLDAHDQSVHEIEAGDVRDDGGPRRSTPRGPTQVDSVIAEEPNTSAGQVGATASGQTRADSQRRRTSDAAVDGAAVSCGCRPAEESEASRPWLGSRRGSASDSVAGSTWAGNGAGAAGLRDRTCASAGVDAEALLDVVGRCGSVEETIGADESHAWTRGDADTGHRRTRGDADTGHRRTRDEDESRCQTCSGPGPSQSRTQGDVDLSCSRTCDTGACHVRADSSKDPGDGLLASSTEFASEVAASASPRRSLEADDAGLAPTPVCEGRLGGAALQDTAPGPGRPAGGQDARLGDATLQDMAPGPGRPAGGQDARLGDPAGQDTAPGPGRPAGGQMVPPGRSRLPLVTPGKVYRQTYGQPAAVRCPCARTADGTVVHYRCHVQSRFLRGRELDDGVYNPIWTMRGFSQTFHFWKESRRTSSMPLNAYLTYVMLPWHAIINDLITKDNRQDPILSF